MFWFMKRKFQSLSNQHFLYYIHIFCLLTRKSAKRLELLQFKLPLPSPPSSPESGKLWLLPLLFPCQTCPQFSLWKDAFLSNWAGGSVAQRLDLFSPSSHESIALPMLSEFPCEFSCHDLTVWSWLFLSELGFVLFFWHSMSPNGKQSLPVVADGSSVTVVCHQRVIEKHHQTNHCLLIFTCMWNM